MTASTSDYFDLDDHGGVSIVRVAATVIRHPAQAEEFSKDLARLIDQEGARRLVLDMRECEYLGSSAFAVLIGLSKKVAAAGGTAAIFGFQHDVSTGANIIGLGTVIPIFETEDEAMAAV